MRECKCGAPLDYADDAVRECFSCRPAPKEGESKEVEASPSFAVSLNCCVMCHCRIDVSIANYTQLSVVADGITCSDACYNSYMAVFPAVFPRGTV